MHIALPNPFATRQGRMAAFLALYFTQGIPFGLVGAAIATQLRRQGAGPAEIGAFVAAFYLPLGLKWALGPFVDVLRSPRFGHRRAWMLLAQSIGAAALLFLAAVPMPSASFTGFVMLLSLAVAMHDVTVDSIAVNALAPADRGFANGLMFAGAILGQAAGGAGVLYLVAAGLPLQVGFGLAAAAFACAALFIALPMREDAPSEAQAPGARRWSAIRGAVRDFAAQSFSAFTGSRGASSGVLFVLLPAGAMSLGSALSANLAVEFGMKNEEIASLNLWTSVLAAVAMVAGGWLSDRFDRRRMLAMAIAGMSVPVLVLMLRMQAHGYVMPRAPGGPRADELIALLWGCSLAYIVFGGLMTGARGALMMDVTSPRVAATQFTAYMAMINLAFAFGTAWQGAAAQAWGYPVTLAADALAGLACIALLPGMRPARGADDGRAHARARMAAIALGASCLSWLAYWPARELFGKGQPVISTVYTLAFVASALFLLAARAALPNAGPAWRRAVPWVAPLLLALYARRWIAPAEAPGALQWVAGLVLLAVPLAAAALLFTLPAPRPEAAAPR